MSFLFGKKDKEKLPEVSVKGEINAKTNDQRLQKEIAANKKQWDKEKKQRDKQHEKNIAALDFQRLIPGDAPAKFSSLELSYLDYVDGMKIAKPRTAVKWTEQGIDFQKTLEKFFKCGVLQFNSNLTALQLTEKGSKIVQANKKKMLDEKWLSATKNSQKHLKAGELNLYRNDLLEMADVRKAEGHRDEELRLLLIICYLDFWPFGDLARYRYFLESKDCPVPSSIIAPGIIVRISSAAKAIGCTPAGVEQMFCREVQADIVPAPTMTIQMCAKLVRMSMEGKQTEANKILNRENNKFIKSHRRK